MHDVRKNAEEHAPVWIRAIKAKFAGEGFFDEKAMNKLLGQCQAVSDVPAALFGSELAAMYPDAKVIILNRDPEKWYDSVLNSIYSAPRPKLKMLFCIVFNPTFRAWIRFGKTFSHYGLGFNHATEKDKALAWYKRTYDEFRENISEERRIEYSVGDGWGPLCEHLGVPVPMIEDGETGKTVEAPFPHLNDRAAFVAEVAYSQSGWLSTSFDNMFQFVGKAVVTGSTAYIGYLFWKTRVSGRV